MPKLLRSSETAGCGATIELDSREVVYVSIAQIGVLVRLWDMKGGLIKTLLSNFFGPKLYNESSVYKNAQTARALSMMFPEQAPYLQFKNPVLAAFANAIWHCSSVAEVCVVLNEAAAKIPQLDDAAEMAALQEAFDAAKNWPPTAMAPSEQKAQKSFELRDSRDILEKLQWELSNLFSRQRHDIKVCQYHAFNCAVTAWHATDWLWQDISQGLRSELQVRSLQDFQDYVRKACPELNLCHQIANGSKHCLLERNPDPTISAVISDGEGYDYGNPVIVEGDTRHMADKVFYDALFWFQAFVRDRNVFSDEPFVPMGDP